MSKLSLGSILTARATAWAAQRAEEEIGRGDLHDDDLDSGVHAYSSLPPSSKTARERTSRPSNDVGALVDQVTLIVYAWHNVQPGAMSWVFPNVRQAIAAAKAMRNAISWAIVQGHQPAESLDEARARGTVLLEHAG